MYRRDLEGSEMCSVENTLASSVASTTFGQCSQARENTKRQKRCIDERLKCTRGCFRVVPKHAHVCVLSCLRLLSTERFYGRPRAISESI